MLMKKKLLIIVPFLVLFINVASSYTASAKTSDEIIFKDKNLQNALSKYYNWNEAFTKEKASEFSNKDDNLFLDYCDISYLDGLQYFEHLIQVNLRGNTLSDLSVLPNLVDLSFIDISYSLIKGNNLENILGRMGKINKLDMVYLINNELTDITFLEKIGYISKYHDLDLDKNTISDIAILKKATNLEWLKLADNRITDVSPLKNLKKLTGWLDLKDNCIIDYKPIKHILDKIYEEGGWDGVISRYDYYSNPVDVGVNGKTVKFPYLTVYYKYQAYVEAIPLFKALGGNAQYNKKTGTLTCKYNENVLVIKDFSCNYTLNGKQMNMSYPMRRMQYDLAYVPVMDICKALGLNYKVTKQRKLSEREDDYFYAPKYIDITKVEKELG